MFCLPNFHVFHNCALLIKLFIMIGLIHIMTKLKFRGQKPSFKLFSFATRFFSLVGKGSNQKKKREKSGQADRLGWPPPLPRSGQKNIKISRQVVIFGVILPFYNVQNGPKFSQNRSGQAGGRWPPPKAVSLTAFFPFFFNYFPYLLPYLPTNLHG